MANKEIYEGLLDSLGKRNLSEDMDFAKRKEIASQVSVGYDIDKDSRDQWLTINNRAMDIVHYSGEVAEDRDYPFEKAAKVIYPLIGPAIIQFAAKLTPHFRRNDEAVGIAVAGADPTGEVKARAERVYKHMNWELLDNSDWVLRNHKLASILASWGVVYRKQHYDAAEDNVVDEIVHPKDVIINNNIQTLAQANRITIINYLNKNDIISSINQGYFNSDIDFSVLDSGIPENIEIDPRDKQPIYEIKEQYCYIDLDEDGYSEPYIAFVHTESETLLGLYCAFESRDIKLDKGLNFIGIKRRLTLVDFHCMDDPDGGYYSLGLNHLLVNLNDAITAMLRNLIDSGTQANYQGGFVTKAIKTKVRNIEFNKLGQWKVLETAPDVDLSKAFFPLPSKEPSAVLFQLLGMLQEVGKEVGFITDVLTGDVPAQNVPATTILALIEQGTRAFKPIIEKLYCSLSKEFRIRFDLSRNISNERYVKFQNDPMANIEQDYDSSTLDLTPVADPSLSSEAHKYAKMQMLQTLLPILPNPLEALTRLLKGLEMDDIQALLTPPNTGPQQPDPKVLQAQMDAQHKMAQLQLQEKELQLQQAELQIKAMKAKVDQSELGIKEKESSAKIAKLTADAYKDKQEGVHKERMVRVAEDKNKLETERLRIMEIAARNKGSNQGS